MRNSIPPLYTIQNWITQFKQGKRQSLEDALRSGRPCLIDDDKIEAEENDIKSFPNASVLFTENELSLKKS